MKNTTNILLAVICLLLAMGIGFYAGSESSPHFMPVKISAPGSTDIVLVFNTRTGKLDERYWQYGVYNRVMR